MATLDHRGPASKLAVEGCQLVEASSSTAFDVLNHMKSAQGLKRNVFHELYPRERVQFYVGLVLWVRMPSVFNFSKCCVPAVFGKPPFYLATQSSCRCSQSLCVCARTLGIYLLSPAG